MCGSRSGPGVCVDGEMGISAFSQNLARGSVTWCQKRAGLYNTPAFPSGKGRLAIAPASKGVSLVLTPTAFGRRRKHVGEPTLGRLVSNLRSMGGKGNAFALYYSPLPVSLPRFVLFVRDVCVLKQK